MWEAIVAGAFTGMVFGILPGGVIFAILQHSIDLGWRKGIGIASGVILSDLLLITFVNFSINSVGWVNKYDIYISSAGILLFLILGVTNIVNPVKPIVYPETRLGSRIYLISTGFMLNTLNPINFLMWIGVSSQIKVMGFFSDTNVVFYFAAALFMIFFIECLISYFASKVRRWMSSSRMRKLNISVGIIYFILALKLCLDAYRNF